MLSAAKPVLRAICREEGNRFLFAVDLMLAKIKVALEGETITSSK